MQRNPGNGPPSRPDGYPGDPRGSDPRYGWDPESGGGARTAGEGNGMPGGPPVRDWQRNTWYGPVPSDVNPFDEPEDAPELRESRSESVNDHLGDFWQQEGDGYAYPGAQARRRTAGDAGRVMEQRRKPKEQAPGKTRKIVLSALAALLALFAVLRFAVFTVREIRVEGNRELTDAEVVRISGIRQGDSILSIDEKGVEERIEGDYRLIFRYMARELPSTVVLSVREREACCFLTYGGILYKMDKNRMVMFETESLEDTELIGEIEDSLVEVKGLEIRSGSRVGQTLVLNSSRQQQLFTNLFLEMKVLGCTALIREADLSNTDSVLLQTRDGFTVSFGDGMDVHAKLRALLLVREKLLEMGREGGTINVTNPVNPLYSPLTVPGIS